MTHAPDSFPVHVRMRWLDFSPSLQWYTTRRLEAALRRFARRIRWVNVQIADGNGPRGGPDDKMCEIEVFLHPSGSIVATAASPDPYLSVDRAVRRLRTTVRARLARTHDHRDRGKEPQIA